MSASARKVIVVPVSSVGSPLIRSVTGLPALVLLCPQEAVAAHLYRQLLRQRVDDRHPDAVQPSRDLVAATVAKLSAGVEDGQYDLDCGKLLLGHDRDRDAGAVIANRDPVVRVDDHRDVVTAAGQRLINRVVNNLVDEMMKAARTRGSDVHAGTLADGLEPLEDRDVLCVITGLLLWAPSAVVVSQRSSDDIETPRDRAWCGAPGRRKLLYIRIAQRPPERPSQAPKIYLQMCRKCYRLQRPCNSRARGSLTIRPPDAHEAHSRSSPVGAAPGRA